MTRLVWVLLEASNGVLLWRRPNQSAPVSPLREAVVRALMWSALKLVKFT